MKQELDTPEADDIDIIDIHTHLGAIINENGGDIIDKDGIRPKSYADMTWIAHLVKFGKKPSELKGLARAIATYTGRRRIMGATLQNMRRARAGSGISRSCVLPVPPYVAFNDLKKASAAESTLIPFTGVDFGNMEGFDARLREDVAQGARGMKIHPIIQNVSSVDERMFQVLDEFAQYDLPILFHTGRVTYYFGEERKKENPDNGRMEFIEEMVRQNRGEIKIILGHAGMSQYDYVVERMPRYPNVYVDTTFQHPERIRGLINAFGSERVLFGSDWPYGDIKPHVRFAREALGQENDQVTTSRVLRDNAKNLLHL
jgi:hypothetical protein